MDDERATKNHVGRSKNRTAATEDNPAGFGAMK
jgi:hypothetical protein